MGDILLNALPLHIKADANASIGCRWQRDNAVDARIRELPGRDEGFCHISHREYSYAWALPDGSLPDAAEHAGTPVTMRELPAAVVAFAARIAAVNALLEKGFAVCSTRIGQPARFSRRRENLAAGIVDGLPHGVGAYAALAVQGVALSGRIDEPGEVALVIDQWVEHALDLDLATVAQAGIDLVGARLRWRHQSACSCDREVCVGDAGRMLGGDSGGQVSVRDLGGQIVTLPGACLTVHANSRYLARYMASLNGRGERAISEALHQATSNFHKTDKRWGNLQKTADKLFAELLLFEGVTARPRHPLPLPRANKATDDSPVLLPTLNDSTLNFHFGTPRLAANANRGLRDHGPYDEGQKRRDVVNAVVVVPEEFEAQGRKLRRILTDGVQSFKGLKERYHLRSLDIDMQTFPDATLAGYRNAVLAGARSGVDIVFFVTKNEFRYAGYRQNPYLAAKAALASAGVASQAITIETLAQPDGSLQWSSDSVGLAAYTKVGNIPYVLHDPKGGRELVLGVGRADIYDFEKGGRRQRFGASVAVRQDGDFLFAGSTTPVDEDEDYEAHLTRLLGENIARFSEQQDGDPDRLVVYLFKHTGRHERRAIEHAVGDRNIEFAVMHVNRDSPLWLVERSPRRIVPPERGTEVALAEHDRLLVTGDPRKESSSHPVRLTLDRASTYRDMNRLVQQAYGFTKTTYRGFLQSNEPSPILFGRLLAQRVADLAPYGFAPATAAGPLGDTLWFI